MSDELKGLEVLFLWRLAVAGGGDWLKRMKPDPGAKERKNLVRSGLVEESKLAPAEGGRKLMHYALSERGWRWLSEHLDAPIVTRSPAALDILVRLLARLKSHLDVEQKSLGEFIVAGTKPQQGAALPDRVEAAYRSISGGRGNVRVRLADLKETLGDVPRDELDRALVEMATAGRLTLYRLDNPLEIEPRDHEATLRTPSGEERHLVYMGEPRS